MIKDPRQYAEAYPDSNILIKLASQVLENKTTFNELLSTTAAVLKNENDALVNVALNLSPSFGISNLIWQAVNHAINDTPGEISSHIFAIPLVLVAGSKTKTELKGNIDVNKLNAYLSTNNVFDNEIDSFISGKLIDPITLSKIKASQLYYWSRNIKNANLWLPINLDGTPLEVLNEGVFLRFLIGITIGGNTIAINQDAYRNASMGLMKIISEELKNEKVTLFPIPFAPVRLSEAYLIGDSKRKEIAITVAVSNIVKKMREQNLTPTALIAADTEAIKIVVTAGSGDNIISETSLWHLSKFENYEEHVVTLTALLQDMQIEYEYVN